MKHWMIVSLMLLGALGPLRADDGPRLRLYRLHSIQFGDLVVDPSGGTVELTPEGLVKPSPGIRLLGGTLAVVGRISVEGPPRRNFRLDFDPARPALSGSIGAPRIERFLLLSGNGSLTLDGEGRAEVRIGAVVDIQAGFYSGLYRALPDVQIRARLTDSGKDEGMSASLFLPIQGTLRAPMSLECLRSLHFGDLVPGPEGGSLRVEPDSTFHWTGAGSVSFFRRRPVAARFRLQGAAGSGYSLRLPRQEVLLTGPRDSLHVREFTTDASLEGRIPAGGLEFGVGATLALPANTPSGAYSGSFRLEVDYN